jgi:hypothetical protein
VRYAARVRRILLILCLGMAACSSAPNKADAGSQCKKTGEVCKDGDECNYWDCHCSDEDGGLVLYPAFCNTKKVCGTGAEACKGFCTSTGEPTDLGCELAQ